MAMLWIFIVVALFIQEPATTDAAIFLVRQNDLNLWLINGIWLAATVIDIFLGYALGKWVQVRFADTRLVRWAQKWVRLIEDFIGRRGERAVVVLLGVINFPYLNAFLFSWLKLSFRNMFILLFIGNTVYWLIAWGINIGVRSVVGDPHTALYIVIGLGLLFSVVSKAVLSKLLKK